MPIHTLGPFRLDTEHDLQLLEGAPVPLGRRAIALLRSMIERPGTLVSKDALIEAAWPGRAVEESNLPVQIAALRRVFAEAVGGDRSPAHAPTFVRRTVILGWPPSRPGSVSLRRLKR